MDNLYENLENYEDENIVEELKKENNELKCKLEDYAQRMDKLQKNILQDFNKLSDEFKKLERNYSSLLKTAKEEIERKTRIITTLNKEKDEMVLNSIQNKNYMVLRRNRLPLKQGNDHIKTNNKVNNQELANTRDTVTQIESCQVTKRLCSEDTVTSNNTDESKSQDKHLGKRTGITSDSKENIAHAPKTITQDLNKPKVAALSIKHRRKSMPAIRSEVKFSSDEECDTPRDNRFETRKPNIPHDTFVNTPRDNNRYETRKPHTLHDALVHKRSNEVHRLHDERHRYSETSSLDDRYSNYDSKELRSKNRFFESDKFKPRDRNVDTYRFKRHYSPDKFRKNIRNYPDDHRTRPEYNRNRILESPPSDKYHKQRRNRDPRARYERDEYYDYEKSRDRCDDKFAGKHKLVNDINEPSIKRMRSNSNTYHHDEKILEFERVAVQNPGPVAVNNFEHISCQSPDYITPEPSTAQPVREIMNTAATQLEDPRLQSNKYVVQKVNEESVLLSTVIGRNVDLKVVETSNWNIQRVDVPKALTRRPSQCSEELLKDVYSDIEIPLTNMSVESGEIMSCETDEERLEKGAHRVYQDIDKPKDSSSKHFNIISEKPKNIVEDSQHVGLKTKYRIPKKDKGHLKMLLQNKSDSEIELLPITTSSTHNQEKTVIPPTLHKKYDLSLNRDGIKNKSPDVNQDRNKSSMFLNKEIVENDLQLSDETNDCADSENRVTESSNEKGKDFKNFTQSCENPTVSIIKDQCDNLDINIECMQLNVNKSSENIVHDSSKKQKSKKRSHKTSNKDSSINEQPVQKQANEKRTRSTKSKIEPEEMKTKFSELFGDSSSLITPEDLGVNEEPKDQLAVKYIPECENARDAVDLQVTNTIEKPRVAELNMQEIISEDIIKNSMNDVTDFKIKSKSFKSNIDSKKRKSKKKETNDIVTQKEEIDIQSTNNSIQPAIQVHIVENDTNLDLDPYNTNVEVTKHPESNVEPNYNEILTQNHKKLVEILTQNHGNALATSTPQKEINIKPQIDIDSTLSDTKGNNNNVKYDPVTNVDNNSTTADQSSNNDTMDTDADAPDVRIFVKRRRRVLKKTQS